MSGLTPTTPDELLMNDANFADLDKSKEEARARKALREFILELAEEIQAQDDEDE